MLRRSLLVNTVLTRHQLSSGAKTAASASKLSFAQRFCTSGGSSGSSSASGAGVVRGPVGSVFRIVGLTAAFAVGTFTVIIISWPILDAIALPRLFTRAIKRGGDQFKPCSLTRSEGNSIDDELHEFDKLQAENLSRILFDSNASPTTSSNIETGYCSASASSVVVLTGPPGSHKSDLARRVSLLRSNRNDKNQDVDRPVLYINLRGYVDSATFLHGTLSYLLLPSLGTVGALVHAYIKLVNAGIDLLTMNNAHEYNSFIIFCMVCGHFRSAMFRIRNQQRSAEIVDRRPLVILDHVEQAVHNQHLFGKDSPVNLMAHMLVTFLVRAAIDEKICNLVLVADSSCLTNKYTNASIASSSRLAGGDGSSRLPSRRNNSDYFVDYRAGFEDNFLVVSSAASSSSSSAVNCASSSSSSSWQSIADSDLLQCFPVLRQRVKFAYATPRQIFPRLAISKNLSNLVKPPQEQQDQHSSSCSSRSSTAERQFDEVATSALIKDLRSVQTMPDEVCEKVLRRCVDSSSSSCCGSSGSLGAGVPPLLTGWIAALLLNTTLHDGCALDAATLAKTLDQDQDTVWSCLEALEAEGLADRVAGTSLLFPSADEAVLSGYSSCSSSALRFAAGASSSVSTSTPAPAFLASPILQQMTGQQILQNSSVDVRIPIEQRSLRFVKSKTSSSSSSSTTEHVLTPSVVFKRVSLSLQDTLSKDTVLKKLTEACLRTKNGKKSQSLLDDEYAAPWNGIVLPRGGENVLVSTQEEFDSELKCLRNGEVVTPSLFCADQQNTANPDVVADENVSSLDRNAVLSAAGGVGLGLSIAAVAAFCIDFATKKN